MAVGVVAAGVLWLPGADVRPGDDAAMGCKEPCGGVLAATTASLRTARSRRSSCSWSSSMAAHCLGCCRARALARVQGHQALEARSLGCTWVDANEHMLAEVRGGHPVANCADQAERGIATASWRKHSTSQRLKYVDLGGDAFSCTHLLRRARNCPGASRSWRSRHTERTWAQQLFARFLHSNVRAALPPAWR